MRHPLTVLALLAITAVASAEDKPKKVENFQCLSWAKFKVGSSVVTKTTAKLGEHTQEKVTTCKLVEVADDKLVIEIETVAKLDGQESKVPATKLEVPKEVNSDKALPLDPKTGKPNGATEEGKEKVKVGGTEYDCRWYKFKTKTRYPDGKEGPEVEGQIWMCDDVPGRLVKSMTKQPDGTTMDLEVTEVTVKK